MFSKNLKYCRKNKNLTQAQVAAFFEVDRSTYGKWETGDRMPEMNKMLEIARFFNVSLDFLMDNEKSVKSPPLTPEVEEIQSAMQHMDNDERERCLAICKAAFPDAFNKSDESINSLFTMDTLRKAKKYLLKHDVEIEELNDEQIIAQANRLMMEMMIKGQY